MSFCSLINHSPIHLFFSPRNLLKSIFHWWPPVLLVVNLFLLYLHFNCMLGPEKRRGKCRLSVCHLALTDLSPRLNSEPLKCMTAPSCLCASVAYHGAWNELCVQKECDERKQSQFYPRQIVVSKCSCISTIQFFQKARLCCVRKNVPRKCATISNPSCENFWVNMLW